MKLYAYNANGVLVRMDDWIGATNFSNDRLGSGRHASGILGKPAGISDMDVWGNAGEKTITANGPELIELSGTITY